MISTKSSRTATTTKYFCSQPALKSGRTSEKIAFQLCALSGRFGVSRSEGLWCLGGEIVANVRTHAMPASHVGQVREPSTAGAIYRRLMLVLVPISLLLLMYQGPAS